MDGIAISVYDKFEAVGILTDIVREHWEDTYYIVVCCSHPDAEERLASVDVDAIVTPASVSYTPELTGEKRAIYLNSRILNSIATACQTAIDAGCARVMHVHADAWPLDEDTFDRLAERLQARDRAITMRGLGVDPHPDAYWIGFAMDQFFVFDADACNDRDVFEFDLFDPIVHRGIHDAFLLHLLGRLGRTNVDFYSDMSTDEWWDGKSTVFPYAVVRPAIYNPEWALLHVHREDFPSTFGAELQAIYLREHGLTTGRHIEPFLTDHDRSREAVTRELDGIERRQDRRLRRLGYAPERFGRRFEEKAEILEAPPREKAQALATNVAREMYVRIDSTLCRYLPLDDDTIYERWWIRARRLADDPNWPGPPVSETYRRHVDRSDFPDDASFWFEE